MKNLILEDKVRDIGIEVGQLDRDDEIRFITVMGRVSIETYLKRDQVETLIEYLQNQLS